MSTVNIVVDAPPQFALPKRVKRIKRTVKQWEQLERTFQETFASLRQQVDFQANVASSALVTCDGLVQKCDELQREVAQLKYDLTKTQKQTEGRTTAIKEALAVFKHVEPYNDDYGTDDTKVVLEKKYIADFFITLNTIEEP